MLSTGRRPETAAAGGRSPGLRIVARTIHIRQNADPCAARVARRSPICRLTMQDSTERHFADLARDWSADGRSWATLHEGDIVHAVAIGLKPRFDAELARHVQRLLDLGEQPLTGVQHIHNAERSMSNRFACIEAAIAAELAIKGSSRHVRKSCTNPNHGSAESAAWPTLWACARGAVG